MNFMFLENKNKVFFEGKHIRVYDCGKGVKHLTLSRPDVHNAFNREMIAELSNALSELAAIRFIEEMRLLLMTGEGASFCAGADLNYMRSQAEQTYNQNEADARELGQLFFKLANFPTPVLTRVQGAAIGGGLGLAVCSDYVVAEEKAVFATSEVLLGIVPGVISPYIVRKIGLANGGPLMLTGKRVKGTEAQTLGLCQEVVSQADLDVAFEKSIQMFFKAAPNAQRRTKALMRKASPLPGSELFLFTCQAIAEARQSDEGKAGLAAFFEKTTPPWQEWK